VKPEYESIEYDPLGFFILTKRSESGQPIYYIFARDYKLYPFGEDVQSVWLIESSCIATIRKAEDKSLFLEIYSGSFKKIYTKPYRGEILNEIKVLTTGLFYLPTKEKKVFFDQYVDGDYMYTHDTVPVKYFSGLLLDKDWQNNSIAKFRDRYITVDRYGRIKSNYLYNEIFTNVRTPYILVRFG